MADQKLFIKHLGIVIAVLVPYVVVYLAAAFVFWEFNPGAWTEAARFFTATLGAMGSGLSVLIYREMQ